MRQGEACRLRRDDVDLNEETIVIEDSKFGKSRMVFLHLTTAAALRAYSRARDEAFPEAEAPASLLNSLGRPLNSRNTPKTFAQLVFAAGINAPPGQRAPRLHDLRADGPRSSQPKRRTFTAEHELAMIEKYDAATEPGAKGALLRGEGLYDSHISYWRKARGQICHGFWIAELVYKGGGTRAK